MIHVVKLSKEELGAIKTVASIKCVGISCSNCPLNLKNIPNIWTDSGGCFKNIACDIVAEHEEE